MPIRKMLPRTRRPTEQPAWELTDDRGKVVGWVEARSLRGARDVFYKAIGVHPETGARVSLELSADYWERCAVVYDFHEHPERYRRHMEFVTGW
jgi:hypothetical protein